MRDLAATAVLVTVAAIGLVGYGALWVGERLYDKLSKRGRE